MPIFHLGIALSALSLCLFPCVRPAEGSMVTITSSVYACADGGQLNPGRWWTEPIPADETPDRFFLCGGSVPAQTGTGVPSATCDRIDIDACSVTPTARSMTVVRQALQPICDGRGLCWLIGGNTSGDEPASRDIDSLRPRTEAFKKERAALTTARLVHASAVMDDGTILVSGGYGIKDPQTGKGPVLKTAEIVDPRRRTAKGIAMLHARAAHSITRLPDGTFLLVGGSGDDPAGAEIYDPKAQRFTAVPGKMSEGRKDHRAVLADDGKVYIVGGTMGKGAPVTIEVYDPATETFSDTGLRLSQGREDLAVAHISPKRYPGVPELIVAIGGEVKGASGEPESKAIDVIDLTHRAVTSGSLTTPRDEATVVVRSVDPVRRIVKLLVLTGQQKGKDGTEVSLPAEEITVAF